MAAAADPDILECARVQGRVVVTLDSDFHALLAVGGLPGPSVIRIRQQGMEFADELRAGSMITAKARKTTCRLL